MGEHAGLLQKHLPQLMYDSNEQFFADAAEEALADGNAELRRRGEGGDTVLASGKDLTLELLGSEYGNGLGPAGNHDFLICPSSDHRELAQHMHAQPELRNVIHGHAREGSDGRLWLQYWFYYFYNDYSMAGGFGLHEGDWEMVQLRMKADPGQGPDAAVYAQHKQAEYRDWHDVETVDRAGVRPVVYSACGSHASYFEQGLHRVGPVWWDVTDGERGSPADTRLVELEHDALPRWAEWPGVWGGTHARIEGIEQPSPPGPRGPEPQHRPHWDDPAKIDYRRQEPPSRLVDPSAEPPVEVTRQGGSVIVHYDIHALLGTEHEPERLNVTVNKQQAAGEFPRTPPRTYTFAIEHTRAGTLDIEAWLDPDRVYDVRVRLVTPAGRPSAAKCVLLGKPPPTQPVVRAWNTVTKGIRFGWARTGRPLAGAILGVIGRLRGRSG
jgi:hypothetical protein